MKSRWTTFVLLAAVVAVWGVVAWRIFVPRRETIFPAERKPVAAAVPKPSEDTLRLDYPDPFLKNLRPGPASAASSGPRAPRRLRRGRIAGVHLGTVVSGSRRLDIVVLDGTQYELCKGETGGGYTLWAHDRDSVYLRKEDVIYGIGLCRDAKRGQ